MPLGMKGSANSPMSTTSVFVSHAYDEAELAWSREFVQELERLGVRVWFDETSLRPGDEIGEAIEKALRESDWVLLVVSSKSVHRPNLLFELGAALTMGKRVIAVVSKDMDPAQLPSPLRTRRFILQRSPKEAARELFANQAVSGQPTERGPGKTKGPGVAGESTFRRPVLCSRCGRKKKGLVPVGVAGRIRFRCAQCGRRVSSTSKSAWVQSPRSPRAKGTRSAGKGPAVSR